MAGWEWSWNRWSEQDNFGLGHWEIGAGVFVAKPFFEDSTAFTASNTPPVGPSSNKNATTFQWEASAAPIVWAAWKTGCMGIRASYFTFDETSRTIAVANPPTGPGSLVINEPETLPDPKSFIGGLSTSPPFHFGDFFSPSIIALRAAAPPPLGPGIISPDHLTFVSSLRVDTVTLEATEEFALGSVAFMVSGGARYLYHRQSYHATLTNNVTVGAAFAIENDTLDYEHTFTGGGPTASVCARQPFGETGLSMYGNVRGSFMVGTGRQTFRAVQLIHDTGISPPPPAVPLTQSTLLTDQFASNRDDTLPVIELEIGLEYTADFGAWLLFTQAGIVGQNYFGAGSAVSENGNMSLFGLQFSLGVTR
jgi:hypothetical protein